MQKIISLFKRDYEGTRQVFDEVVPGAEWVIAGEGKATVKWDGTCCRVTDQDGVSILWRRYDAKHGKSLPEGFEAAQDPDETTGHWPGWVPCRRDNPADRWHFEAYDAATGLSEGTYELVGPKVQGNPYRLEKHMLYPHGVDVVTNAPRDFEGLKDYFSYTPFEGIVWHHPDGRLVKIKRKDFGFTWPARP
jgi:hypothetical protein